MRHHFKIQGSSWSTTKKRLPLLTAALTSIALILALVCLLAGSAPGVLESGAILTLNTSKITHFLDAGNSRSSPSSSSSGSSSIFGGRKSSLSDLSHDVGTTIENGFDSVTKGLHIPDFYSLHVLDYCQGEFRDIQGSGSNKLLSTPTKDVRKCSKATVGYTFGLQQILQNHDADKTALTNKVPSDVKNAIHSLTGALKAISVLYCIAIFAVALQSIFTAFNVFGGSGRDTNLSKAVTISAALSMGLCSVISTAIAFYVQEKVNNNANDLPVSAEAGHIFIGLMWTATILLLLADLGYHGSTRQ